MGIFETDGKFKEWKGHFRSLKKKTYKFKYLLVQRKNNHYGKLI